MRHTSAFASDCIKMLAFPVIFAGSGLALYGFSFHPIAVYTILFISIVVAVCLEYLIPFDRSWNKSQNDVPTDTAHFIVAILTSSFTKTFAILLHAWLARLFPISMVNLFGAQQFVVKVLFAMIISGFMPYWLHRASHLTSGFLWRIHSVHHVPERLYWFNSTHMHPINVMWNTFLSLFPLYVLGFDNEVIMMTGVLNNIVSIYNHANIDLKLGWLNWIFNMNDCTGGIIQNE
jgi:sterol desaturase/sphingolipid hydroxylase (fatty acid hydroxylase superfamily)